MCLGQAGGRRATLREYASVNLFQTARTCHHPRGCHILASTGDERNALLMLTVQADFGGEKATLPGARLYLLDDNNKIKTEHVIFYAAQD